MFGNTFLAVVAAAVFLFGPVGVSAVRQSVQTPVAATQQVATLQTPTQQTGDCAIDSADEADNEAADNEADADTLDVQCGDQNAPDAMESGAASDTETEAADSEQNDAAPTATPAISADQAQATAEAHLNAGSASKVELDDENGLLVYGVEIGNTDVKVDAMTGAVVTVENDQDGAEGVDANEPTPESASEAPVVGG
ncbi:PepSY domain-containing protein [Caldilinea sp.]|uniref:PepSY domain-containing protein n=1 Tax=Caldilinea sp. TaxID=2293560 RepID=UPI002B9A08C1|nr:PepSY domain-containing protein [Anaerolineales bacterium]HQY91265.1 PepSY domain-containing protein [Caldilinea sp.]HRA67230.1 PepSY domain-containing protein [Caldilinea sp.]